MSLTVSATTFSITWAHCSGYSLSRLPCVSSMAVTGRELQCSPRAAKVAYASAISSGLTSETPRVKAGTLSVSGSVSSMPMSLASS